MSGEREAQYLLKLIKLIRNKTIIKSEFYATRDGYKRLKQIMGVTPPPYIQQSVTADEHKNSNHTSTRSSYLSGVHGDKPVAQTQVWDRVPKAE